MCRLISTKYYLYCATAYPLPVCRGCLFITYEVEALDKAVTIDTRAILQEKYKSYIYLRATPSDEKENLAAGTKCHSPCWMTSGKCAGLYILRTQSQIAFAVSRCPMTSAQLCVFPSFPSLSFLSAYLDQSVAWSHFHRSRLTYLKETIAYQPKLRYQLSNILLNGFGWLFSHTACVFSLSFFSPRAHTQNQERTS